MQQYVTLTLLWIGFSFLHSFFASAHRKQKIQLKLGQHYKFYRISYSLFALLTLSVVIIYHISIKSAPLWIVSIFEKIAAIVFMIAGAFTMLVFTKKFFFDLSGADVFLKKNNQQKLIQSDLYKYVRHPLYLATLVFVWSIFFFYPSLSNLISCTCLTGYTLIGIYFEEKKLIQEFGDSYLLYKQQTPMLIPKIF